DAGGSGLLDADGDRRRRASGQRAGVHRIGGAAPHPACRPPSPRKRGEGICRTVFLTQYPRVGQVPSPPLLDGGEGEGQTKPCGIISWSRPTPNLPSVSPERPRSPPPPRASPRYRQAASASSR